MNAKPDPARRLLEERRDHARRDLAELDQQVADGEIDETTAGRLAEGYRRELRQAEEGLAALPPAPSSKPAPAQARRRPTPKTPTAKQGAGEVAPRGLPVKGLAALGALAVVLTVVIVIIGTSGGDEQASAPATVTPTTGAAPGVSGDSDDPIAQLESAVAANPQVNGMRLALAGLYFDRGEYLASMEHYLVVLDNAPTPEEESLAVARVGWMAYVTDQLDVAVDYLRSAIALDPSNGEAKLFLGVVLLYGLEDAGEAIPLLEEVLALADLPDTLRPDVENMLAEAREMEAGS